MRASAVQFLSMRMPFTMRLSQTIKSKTPVVSASRTNLHVARFRCLWRRWKGQISFSSFNSTLSILLTPLRPSQRRSLIAGVMLCSHGVAADRISDIHLSPQHPFIDRISKTQGISASTTFRKLQQQTFCQRKTTESRQTAG